MIENGKEDNMYTLAPLAIFVYKREDITAKM